ncbi:hypothetical protein [Synechococcus sp. 1G10]|uniref:hypothetical protein n=1 Tax=Synechococcus sp. 1G10 TaxID=2025605 RepID=UPI00117E3BA9|nr:hypothetical protein [Synechococcus sp. 1G10]
MPNNSQPRPAQDIARRILGEDVTQIDTYVQRVKRMVGRVLIGNGITGCEKGSYALVGGGKAPSGARGTSWISTSQPSTSA